MWPYWLMFMVPALAAVQESARRPTAAGARGSLHIPMAWWAVMFGLTLLVGWREQVGGDWFNYLQLFEDAIYESQFSDWWLSDPGYRLLEWLAIQMGSDVHLVNLLAAAIFSFGLVKFCRNLPRPWLALAVAVPYLVIILGMGYSRQGAALGCIMAGLVALGNGKTAKFMVWAILGATMHKTAVLLLPIAALAASRRRLLTTLWVAVIVATAYVVLLRDSVEGLKENYIDAGYQSQGAFIRLVMNALPAGVLLWKRERFAVSLPQGRLWYWFALASIALIGVYFVSPSSTAVDRVGLYLLPLQLMVFSYLPEVMGKGWKSANSNWVLMVLVYYAAVEFVWLNFADHSFAWLPYRFYPLEDAF